MYVPVCPRKLWIRHCEHGELLNLLAETCIFSAKVAQAAVFLGILCVTVFENMSKISF